MLACQDLMSEAMFANFTRILAYVKRRRQNTLRHACVLQKQIPSKLYVCSKVKTFLLLYISRILRKRLHFVRSEQLEKAFGVRSSRNRFTS